MFWAFCVIRYFFSINFFLSGKLSANKCVYYLKL